MSPASNFLFDAEADLRSADDLARALFLMLERGGELGEDDVGAVLRVVIHLQGHTSDLLKAWRAAMAAEQAASILPETRTAA